MSSAAASCRTCAAPASQAIFEDIVLRGAFSARGMGRFDDVLSRADAADLHSFILERAWDAYRQGDPATMK